MRALGLLALALLSCSAFVETRERENLRDILYSIKNIVEKQNVIILDIQEKLNVVENKHCLQSSEVPDLEKQIENRLLQKFLDVFSDIHGPEDEESSVENMKVEKKAKLLLPSLETSLTRTNQKITEIKSQLNETRMVEEGLWKRAGKEVKATQDIFNQLNASREYFEKSKVKSILCASSCLGHFLLEVI